MRVFRVAVLLLVSVFAAGCAAEVSPSAPPERTSDASALARVFDGIATRPFDDAGRPTHDGKRVLDVLALQGGLIRYRVAHGSYPATLENLVPEISPSLPRDPESGESYAYRRVSDGMNYQLWTTLSNGQVFSGVAHRER